MAGNDHRPAALLAGGLIVLGLILQAPNHPHALALGYILTDPLGPPAPGRDAMPVGRLRLSPSRLFQMRLVARLKLMTDAPFAVKRISGIAPI